MSTKEQVDGVQKLYLLGPFHLWRTPKSDKKLGVE